MKIIIVDDNQQFLESLHFYISLRLGHKVIASYNNANLLLDSQIIYNADIILMDIEMLEINGIKATKLALNKNRELKIIAVTNYQEKAYLTTLVSTGFKGCVYKNNIFEELKTALEVVISDKQYFPKGIPFSKK